MSLRFLHAADIHLGFEQYGSKQRYLDFARALDCLVSEALAKRVDFLLIAGDLFHQRTIEPRTLFQAVKCLERLRTAGIPVIAVEGNHERPYERPSSPKDNQLSRFSWLDYLAEIGLLVLLDPAYKDERLLLDPCEGNIGAYVDLPGNVRVIGMRYYGGITKIMLQKLTCALAEMPGPRPAYTILMLHAGLQGILDNYSATLTRAELEPLRNYADYLALGHIHKPFVQDEWIYNPGSLETNSVAEVEWEDRGYFLVELDPSRQPAHVVTKVRSKRRAFERLRFSVGEYDSPEALHRALEAHISHEATPEKAAQCPVVELELKGTLNFDHADLDTARIKQVIEGAYNPITCLLKDTTSTSEFDIPTDETLSRAELEKLVLRELVERDVRYRAQSEHWANMVLSLKRLALSDSPPEEIVSELRRFGDVAEESQPC